MSPNRYFGQKLKAEAAATISNKNMTITFKAWNDKLSLLFNCEIKAFTGQVFSIQTAAGSAEEGIPTNFEKEELKEGLHRSKNNQTNIVLDKCIAIPPIQLKQPIQVLEI